MKKKYIAPEMNVTEMETTILCASAGIYSIKYSADGVDDEEID